VSRYIVLIPDNQETWENPGRHVPGHRYDGVRAELLTRAGRADEAVAAYDSALEACGNDAERAHLAARRARVARDGVPL
jgi:predicted RNA polymerase sigma factor